MRRREVERGGGGGREKAHQQGDNSSEEVERVFSTPSRNSVTVLYKLNNLEN